MRAQQFEFLHCSLPATVSSHITLFVLQERCRAVCATFRCPLGINKCAKCLWPPISIIFGPVLALRWQSKMKCTNTVSARIQLSPYRTHAGYACQHSDTLASKMQEHLCQHTQHEILLKENSELSLTTQECPSEQN